MAPRRTFHILLLTVAAFLSTLTISGFVFISNAHLPGLGSAAPALVDARASAAAAMPDRIAIPAIGVDAVIVNAPRVGNTWESSHLTSQVGHMEATAYPGQGSNVVLVAHRYLSIRNGQPANPGPFALLDRLRPGDQILVHSAGTVYTYTMTEQLQITRRDTWIIGETDGEMVTLMTCDAWNPTTLTYDKLLVVRGRLADARPIASAPAVSAPATDVAGAPAAPVTAAPVTSLNIRSGPGTVYAPVGVTPAGAPLAVVGRNTAANWILVEAGGVRGWVAAWYTVVYGDLNSVPVTAL